MADERGDGFSDMPKWPKQATDIPEPYRPGGGGESYPIIGLVVGLVVGFLPLLSSLSGTDRAEKFGAVIGGLFMGAVGYLFCLMISRRRAPDER